MGLECLSRGAETAIFFELDRSALARLRDNIKTLEVEKKSTVIATDLFRYFSGTQAIRKADLIFLDPPYRFLNEQPESLRELSQSFISSLNLDGILIFRHDAMDKLELPAFEKFDERNYGGMTLEFLHAPQ